MPKLVLLPSGVVIDANRIMFIGKDSKAIGQYIIFLENSGGMAPLVDGTDLDSLVKAGIIEKLTAPPLIAS